MSSSCAKSRVGIGLTAVLVTTGLAVLPATPATAAVIQCPASADTFVWDGDANDPAGMVGDNRNWDDAYNWDVNCTPGLRFQDSGDPYDDVVTIPTGADVYLNDGESAHIARLTNNGSLTITTGARMTTSGDSSSRVLTLRGLLAGTGRFTVTSRLEWISTTEGAATQSSRDCTSQCAAPLPSGSEGTTVIAAGATLDISGRGVNLSDQRVIENHGTVLLTGSGYIAADYGTWFRNVRSTGTAPVPRFVIRNDGGYYQGFAQFNFGLSRFTNGGKVVKDGGTGVSVIDAAYTPTDAASTAAGKVEVRAGSLSIVGQTDQVRSARVRQGLTFGNGGCSEGGTPTDCGVLRPTAEDRQLTTVQLTQSGTALATVRLRELPPLAGTGHRGVPVQIDTPNAQSAPTTPLRFRMLLDATLVFAGETAGQVAQTAPVYRQATTTQPYVQLPDCDASGNPTIAQPSCVSRDLSVSETAAIGSGDVVLVISSLQNSRYRIGR